LKENFVTYSHVTNLCAQLYDPHQVVEAFKSRFHFDDTAHLKRSPEDSYFPTFFNRETFYPIDFENAITMAKFIADHFDKSDETGPFLSNNILMGKGALMPFKECLSVTD